MNHRIRSASRPAVVALVILLVLPLTGCLFSREISQTRREIETAYPDLRLEREVVVNLGPISLAMIGWMAGLVPDQDVAVARRYLKDVSRVKVGVFRAEGAAGLQDVDAGLFGFEKGWQVAVKARQEEERVWVLYRDGPETLRDLYVVVLNDEDLVVARVRGRLDRLIARVMEDRDEIGDWIGASM